MDDTVQSTDDGVPVYSQPPFWAKSTIEPELEETVVESVEPQPLEEASPVSLSTDSEPYL